MGRTEAVMKIVPVMIRIIAMGMRHAIGMNVKMHVFASALDFRFPIITAA
jgi:hypothetical protein